MAERPADRAVLSDRFSAALQICRKARRSAGNGIGRRPDERCIISLAGETPYRVKALMVLIRWSVQEPGRSAVAAGLKPGVSQSAVSRAVQHIRRSALYVLTSY